MNARLTNWAGNLTYRAERVLTPNSVGEVQDIVRSSPALRALGSRHSFNGVADTTGDLVSLERLTSISALDREKRTVTIDGGIRYGQLGAFLHAQGFALRNMASLPHISVAGACATATHGSGESNSNLATSVNALQMVTANGDLIAVSRAHDPVTFPGMVVALGALGIITQLTLDVIPTFDVRQDVYESLSLSRVTEQFDAIQSSAYSVSLFTHWTDETFSQVWLKRRISEDAIPSDDDFHGATRAASHCHPISGISAEHCTEQMGIAGPWHERLAHFRLDFTPSSGAELQSEYFVPREHAVAALRAVMALGPAIAPLLLVSEVRTVARDDLWLSPCYERDCVAIHFTWKPQYSAVSEMLTHIEAALEPFDARPHWGKLFVMTPVRMHALIVRRSAFQELATTYDPSGKFRNDFLSRYLFDKAQ